MLKGQNCCDQNQSAWRLWEKGRFKMFCTTEHKMMLTGSSIVRHRGQIDPFVVQTEADRGDIEELAWMMSTRTQTVPTCPKTMHMLTTDAEEKSTVQLGQAHLEEGHKNGVCTFFNCTVLPSAALYSQSIHKRHY